MHADDIALLAPSPSALRAMLKTCSSFAEAHSLIFNASKTQLICFPKTCFHQSLSITFLGHELQLCNSVTHLGHILAYNLSADDLDINRVTSDVCRQANYLLATFSACDILTKTELFRNYCMSLYGSVLCNFGQSSLSRLQVIINNILRPIWHLPRRCHTSILYLTTGMDS